MIKINLPKAQEIAHEKRRAKRDELFNPHDEVIAKQIPGVDANAAEAARQAIRAADEAVQAEIDAAADADALKAALVEYGAL